MCLKTLLPLAIASAFAAEAQAARFVTFSLKAGLAFDITFDTNSVGFPFESENGFSAELLPNELTIYGTPPGFLDYFVSVDLSGYDLSPPEFRYHSQQFPGRWQADYIYYVHQYQFMGTLSGGIYSLTITGTDTPRPTGIAATGTIRIPALPEPASWAMMIGGFGLVGASLRKQRKTRIRFA